MITVLLAGWLCLAGVDEINCHAGEIHIAGTFFFFFLHLVKQGSTLVVIAVVLVMVTVVVII